MHNRTIVGIQSLGPGYAMDFDFLLVIQVDLTQHKGLIIHTIPPTILRCWAKDQLERFG